MPAANREDPIEVLQAHAARRTPDLVSLRHGRMLASPLTFFCGAGAVMAADLATMRTSGIDVQLCGDAHLGNFGSFLAGDQHAAFDVLDFDETLPGPFEWDVKRLAASVAVAGGDRGLSARATRRAVAGAAAGYRQAMRRFAEAPALVASPASGDVERLDHPPLLVPVADPEVLEDAAVQEWLVRYRATLPRRHRERLDRHRLIGIVRRHGGSSGLGPREWILRFAGDDTREPLALQVREAHPSVLAPYLRPRPHEDDGRRVVEGQRLAQGAADAFLASTSGTGPDGLRRDHFARRLKRSGPSDVDRMTAGRLAGHASRCGEALARAHARSGDPVAIATYLGAGARFDEAMAEFAAAYAAVTVDDHALLGEAASAGVIAAERGR